MGILSATSRILNLRCREATALLSGSLDRQLGVVDRWALRLHLCICRSCRRYRRQLRTLRRLIHDAVRRLQQGEDLPGLPLPPEARRRLQAIVDLGRQ